MSPARPRGNRQGHRARRGTGGSRPPSSGRGQGSEPSPARRVAFELLRRVEADGAYANLALPILIRSAGLEPRDAAFATELAFGTLRLRGRYDAVLSVCADRSVADIDRPVLDALRLGCHQLLAMSVPDYAAVSETVALVRESAGRGAASFANAVLRRVAAQSWPSWCALVAPPLARDPLGHWEVAESHPRWIVRALGDALEACAASAELPALLAADNAPGHVTLVARPGRIDHDDLLAETGGRPGRYSPWAVAVTGDPARFPSVRSGAAGVQDEASQLVALALTRAEVTGADDAWLDMCAGPGGKTADLAGLAHRAGAALTAVEQHPHRAELVRTAVGDGATVITGDARGLVDSPQRFSRILLDAPCTGLGALRRRPELRWRRQPADLPALRALQAELLAAAAELLRPGGVVLYATCSPHVAETTAVVENVLRHRDDLARVPAAPLLPEVPDAGCGDVARLWPHRHDTDGMYLAVLSRR